MDITRRGILGTALGAAALTATNSWAAPDNAWVAYEGRLRARLRDAGGGQFLNDQSRDLLQVGNAFRRSQGLGAYAWDEDLAACARAHAADMAQRGYFAHNAPEGFKSAARASLLARDFCGHTGENLAWRQSASTRPGDFQSMWERSPGHRANLLDRSYARAGYGVVRAGDRYYAAAVYGAPGVDLAQALPFRASPADVQRILARSPVERVGFSRPGEKLGGLPGKLTGVPALQPGAWQVRPAKSNGRSFDLLPGPVFVV